MESWNGPPDSQFDADSADGYVGKYLLVGITRTTQEGEVLSQVQLHGIIQSITAHGVELQLRGVNEGKVWRMPPFIDALSPAAPGIYELRSTGEAVEDPDFLFTMTVRKPTQQ
jgi:hypothetical protein